MAGETHCCTARSSPPSRLGRAAAPHPPPHTPRHRARPCRCRRGDGELSQDCVAAMFLCCMRLGYTVFARSKTVRAPCCCAKQLYHMHCRTTMHARARYTICCPHVVYITCTQCLYMYANMLVVSVCVCALHMWRRKQYSVGTCTYTAHMHSQVVKS